MTHSMYASWRSLALNVVLNVVVIVFAVVLYKDFRDLKSVPVIFQIL